MGDRIFDTYYMSNVQSISNTVEEETRMKAAGEALLDKIGPAVVITHSQGRQPPEPGESLDPDRAQRSAVPRSYLLE
jgi:hypothetical protein